MLGIPSRTDAVAIAPDYAEAVAAEELNERLGRFEGVFSNIFPHNHVAEAYRDTGYIEKFMRAMSSWSAHSLQPKKVPRAVNVLLKPELVWHHYLSAIQSFKETLAEAQDLLDHEAEVVVQSPNHERYAGLYPMVEFEECVADYVFVGNGMQLAPGKGKGWKYTFNPFELALAVLSEFERAILGFYDLEVSKIEKIMAMKKIADDFQENANYRIASGAMCRSVSMPFSLEHQKGHPAWKLRLQNKNVGAGSDLYLRFDEVYFVTQTPAGEAAIPATGVLDAGSRMVYHSLSNRVMLRHAIYSALEDRGRVVINGVAYERALIPVKGEVSKGFIADGQSYQELANLLGEPVQQANGVLLLPEAWAAEEVQLVKAFLTSQHPDVADTLLERYELDTSSGNPTREKALGQLAYSCRSHF